MLVIGPSALRAAIARALPRCRSAAAESLLSGLWAAGQGAYDGVIVSLGAGRNAKRVIGCLRQVVPEARIVVTCNPAEEPEARAAIMAGADDYVLEPLQREDLEAALRIPTLPRFVPTPEGLPTFQELVELSEVLKQLADGAQVTLQRLASLVRKAFAATSVTLRVDELLAAEGEHGVPVLEEPIRRQEQVVGLIALGSRREGTYSGRDARRLADYAALVESVVAQARDHARWQELAWRDDLSGLHNRRYFDATLDELVRRATEERLRLTVVLFDIDDFKTYNDRYGHETGDALIQEVAALLTRCSREHDVVARYGGDEFAVILWDAEKPRVPGSQHPPDAMALADRFRQAINEHDFKCLGRHAPGPVTISGGLACLPWDGKTRCEVVRAADAALLGAKRTGKNRIELAGGRAAPPGEAPSAPPSPAAADDGPDEGEE